MAKSNELDMTKGQPRKLLLQFMVPLVIGNVFQQLYNMVDTIIVGRYVGVTAVAAVGSTGTIMFLILGFLMGLLQGFTVLTAQRFGAGDERGVKQSAANAAILAAIMAVIFTFLSVISMDKILHFMNTPDNMYDMAKSYILIICYGIAFTMLYNLLASLLRAVGNSKAPLYFLMISAGINILLDLFCIIVLHMGAAGAAVATVASQGISGILCLIYIYKKVPLLIPRKEDWRLDGQCTSNQMRIGMPMALQFSITAIGTILMQSSLNLLGSVAVAGFTVGNKVESLFTQFYSAVGMTIATYSAQNMGVGRMDRIRKGISISMLFVAIYSIIMYVLLYFNCNFFTRIFVSSGEQDLAMIEGYVETYIRLVGLFFIPLGMIFIYRNVMQGCGFSFWPMMGGVVELVCRMAASIYAAQHQSYIGVCWATASAWLVTGIFLWICYLFVRKQIEQRIARSFS